MRRELYQGRLGGTSGVASLISGMSRAERRALHEAVKRRILKEQSTDGDPDFATSPVGSAISDNSGQVLYRVTREGWQSVAPMNMAQVRAYVKPEHRASMEQQLTRLAVDRSLLLPLAVLGSPNIASAAGGNGLVVLKTGQDAFVERATHSPETIQKIYDKYKANLVYTEEKGGERTDAASGTTYQIGDATVTINGETYTISVPSENLNGFDSLFGKRSGVADIITKKMQETIDPAKTGGDIEIKLPESSALEGSFMKQLDGVGLFGGKIKFTKRPVAGAPFIHTSTLNTKQMASLRRILDGLKGISSRGSP